MQVYRGMDVGTAKVTVDEREHVPHHLIDIANPSDIYTAADFQKAGRAALEDIAARGRNAVVCGGSGLHFRALVDPLEFPPTDPTLRSDLEARGLAELVAELLQADPDAGEVVDLANPRRVMRAIEVYRLTGDLPSRRVASGAARTYVCRACRLTDDSAPIMGPFPSPPHLNPLPQRGRGRKG